jgi:hypothetical protein
MSYLGKSKNNKEKIIFFGFFLSDKTENRQNIIWCCTKTLAVPMLVLLSIILTTYPVGQ